jgi:phosphatidylglycerophosphatase A
MTQNGQESSGESSKNAKIAIAIATFFGAGKVPKAPGTMGSLATLPLAYLLSLLGPLFYMAFIVLLFPVGLWAAEAYEHISGSHDSKEIVIDEVLGMLITLTWLPFTWQAVAIGFVLFRVLDIFKPFPIGLIDKKVQGGLGVIADDVVAGIIANVVLQYIYSQTNWLGVQLVQN